MVFLPNDDAAEATSRKIAEECSAAEGLEVLGWREVPVDVSVVGRIAAATMPRVAQLIVKDSKGRTGADLERALYFARKSMERRQNEVGERGLEFYLCSFSGQVCIALRRLSSTCECAQYPNWSDTRVCMAAAGVLSPGNGQVEQGSADSV
jgi:glutamate synthase (ferredoxin)